MNYIFRECNENEVMALTKMSEVAFKTDKEFSGSDGGPTGYDDYDFHMNHCLEGRLFSLLIDERIVLIHPNAILELIISTRNVDIQQLEKNIHRILTW